MRARRGLRQYFIDFLTSLLVKEHRGYEQRFPQSLERLKEVIRPGDVLLVEGSQRISEVIKYLTQSSWSHAALYVGDAVLKRQGAAADELVDRFGDESSYLLVEATVENGVAPAPLSKYLNHNIRICRPYKLRPGDLNSVLSNVVSQIGAAYSVDHILDLLRYFFPVSLIPQRFRKTLLEHSGTLSKDVICSAQIALAFQQVRYPIRPEITTAGDNGPLEAPRRKGWFFGRRRAPTQRDLLASGVFTPCNPSLVTPRDFDLSPYFEIVKADLIGKRDFDYREIVWSRDVASESEASEEPVPTRQAS
ncbi:MAG: YiiX/YebB-like N1pC/P60 family cysteine hydrolase [Candidatus Binatia bacterium]